MDREARQAAVHRVAESWTRLSTRETDMQFSSSKNPPDEEFNFFNREYAIHIYYIVLSLCDLHFSRNISILPNL